MVAIFMPHLANFTSILYYIYENSYKLTCQIHQSQLKSLTDNVLPGST